MAAITLNCMSLNFSDDVRDFDNPWTGQPVRGPVMLGLTADEQQAALDLLKSINATFHEGLGQFYAAFADDGLVYIDSNIADSETRPGHVQLSIRPAPTLQVTQFLVAFAESTNMVTLTSEPEITICIPSTPVEKVPVDWPATAICRSPSAMKSLLEPVFESHKRNIQRQKKQWH